MSEHPGGSDPPTSKPSDEGNRSGQGDESPPPSSGEPQGGYVRPDAPPGYGAQYVGTGAPQIIFDLRAITPGGLTAVGGAFFYFVFSFFPWYTTYHCPLGPFFEVSCMVSRNAWDRGSAVLSVLIFLLAAVTFVVKALRIIPPKVPLDIIALGMVVLGDVFFLVAFFDKPDGFSRGWGLWIGLVGLLAVNLGAVLQFIKVGGTGWALRALSNLQQRASGPSGYGQFSTRPQQPEHPQAGHPTGGQPRQGDYPSGGPPPHPGEYPQPPQQPG
jgi:hypothetical protein